MRAHRGLALHRERAARVLFARRGARVLPPSGWGRRGSGRLGHLPAPDSGQRRGPALWPQAPPPPSPSDCFLYGFGLGLGRARSPFCDSVRASRSVSGFLCVLCSWASVFAPEAALPRPTSPAPRTGRCCGSARHPAGSLLSTSRTPRLPGSAPPREAWRSDHPLLLGRRVGDQR